MYINRLTIGVISLLCCMVPVLSASSIIEQLNHSVRYQRVLDLSSNLVVLAIAVEPGDEDLGLLSYFRFGRGARVVTSFLTNGDSGISDTEPELPAHLAARRRTEAYKALRYIDSGVHFFAMDYMPPGSSSDEITEAWNRSDIQLNIMKLINRIKPDIVILFSDHESQISQRWKYLYESTRAALYRIGIPDSVIAIPSEHGIARWNVRHTFIESDLPNQLHFPVYTLHPVLSRSYSAIGGEASLFYKSLKHQMPRRYQNGIRPYTSMELDVTGSGIVDIVPNDHPLPPRLEWCNTAVKLLTDTVIQNSRYITADQKSETSVLSFVATVMDSINLHIANAGILTGYERRLLLNWRLSLEELRNELLGVSVQYTLTDPILTPRQLTYFTVTSISGTTEDGITEIFFPAVDDGWFVNESPDKLFSMDVNVPFRIVSPPTVEYTFPRHQFDIKRPEIGVTLPIFIIHRAKSRENSFTYRIDVPLDFAPRFSFELLTPVVYARQSEWVIIRLSNHSRDGVSDIVRISSEDINAVGKRFAFTGKGQAVTDTLALEIGQLNPDSTYIVPIFIGTEPVGELIVRNFPTKVDSSLRVGVVTPFTTSPLIQALHRLGISPGVYQAVAPAYDEHDVIIFDERMFSHKYDGILFIDHLIRFVHLGGKVIVLFQDRLVWNSSPLTGLFDEREDKFIYIDFPLQTRLLEIDDDAYRFLARILSPTVF